MNVPPWHAEPWRQLQSRRERDALAHALLVTGPGGLGKRAFVDRFAHSLLCEAPVEGEACGQCRGCRLLDAGTHPDRVSVELELRDDGRPRSEIVIHQIRKLSERLAMSSQFGGWQVVTIDPADAMNAAAANALLKTLEEPTPSCMIVLVADAPWRLPATIRSRCQRIDFRLPAREEAQAWLREQGVADAEKALEAAGGNPGLALRWHGEDTLAQRDEVRRDMAALAEGRADAYAVTTRWMADAPEQRLRFAAQTAADIARARAAGESPPVPSELDALALDDWFRAASRAREALRGPLRANLLLLEVLGQWR